MAGPLLRVLIRLKQNKYHRMQIAARYRIIDLFKQIAQELQITVDQLLHISIYRNGPNGCSILYPVTNNFNNTHYDVSITFDKYGLSSHEELFLDLTEILHCQQQDNEELTGNEGHTASSLENTEYVHSTASSLLKSDESTSLIQAKTTTSKPLTGQLIRFSVPADNSCLFWSINFVLHSGKLDLAASKYLRNLVASKIESDQITYSEAMLGRTNSEYSKWIRRGKIIFVIQSQPFSLD